MDEEVEIDGIDETERSEQHIDGNLGQLQLPAQFRIGVVALAVMSFVEDPPGLGEVTLQGIEHIEGEREEVVAFVQESAEDAQCRDECPADDEQKEAEYADVHGDVKQFACQAFLFLYWRRLCSLLCLDGDGAEVSQVAGGGVCRLAVIGEDGPAVGCHSCNLHTGIAGQGGEDTGIGVVCSPDVQLCGGGIPGGEVPFAVSGREEQAHEAEAQQDE